MPAESPKQKRFMAMVKARKMGHDVGGPKVQKAASSMSLEAASDFANSPVKKHPARSKEAMKAKMRKK